MIGLDVSYYKSILQAERHFLHRMMIAFAFNHISCWGPRSCIHRKKVNCEEVCLKFFSTINFR